MANILLISNDASLTSRFERLFSDAPDHHCMTVPTVAKAVESIVKNDLDVVFCAMSALAIEENAKLADALNGTSGDGGAIRLIMIVPDAYLEPMAANDDAGSSIAFIGAEASDAAILFEAQQATRSDRKGR